MSIGSYWPDHLLTLAEWEALPEDNSRCYELVEGVLLASPRPASRHQWATLRLAAQIEPQLPADYSALVQSEVVVFDGRLPTVRVPDVLAGPSEDLAANLPRWNATDILLAVEILADGTRRTDRLTKWFEYADAGIEHYWLLDLEPVRLTAYRLIGGGYELVAECSGSVTTELAGSPITIDLTGLTSRRARG
ncbi:Uma2 family endonuclease [Streptomyces gardneri]|uniref:Uma2 family endonuclease n=1 Tax=Nocardia TaxID=1817 RepID=UPI00135A0F2B|nr:MULTISPECIES: Uma2 family endonuclease [Nocardia]MBF6164068.1 Uma2 family endonuclease [Streptomyces gardneri]MBF6203644.1 Uma2 family endonuclease [Streptomyces gardneri]